MSETSNLPTTTEPGVTVSRLARLCLQKENAAGVSPADWPGLIRLALRHGVAPLLHLRTMEQAPLAAHTELSDLYRQNLARNLALTRELDLIKRALERTAVPVILLKGPELAEMLYGNVGARQMADLDVLIPARHLAAADAALAAARFRRETDAPLGTLQACRDVLFVKQGAPEAVFLDLHMRLRPYGRRDALTELLWREPSSEDTRLLMLCLNVLTHRFARLQPWLDLATFLQVRERQLNWARVQHSAEKLEWPGGVFLCLRYASELAGRRVPDCVLQTLAPNRWEQRWALALLGANAEAMLDRAASLDGPRGTLATLACEKGLWPRMRLAASILFPAPATLRQMDSPARPVPLPLHYAERMVRKLRQATRRAA